MPLPFSRSEFLGVFAAYNTAIWPIQFAAAALGFVTIFLLFWRPPWADRTISAVLCFFWLEMAVGYHWLHFAAINEAAYAFGVLFALQALIFLIEGVIRGRMHFETSPGLRSWLAALLIGYAFLVYPLLGLLATHPWPETPLFGVTPCPTTIFTLGFLVLVRHPHARMLAGIPVLWSAIGGSAAFLLDVPQDMGLIVAALLWAVAAILPRQRQDRAAA